MINVNYSAVDEVYRKQWFKDDYYAVKEFLKKHSINDSFPQLVERNTDESIICLIENICLEAEFNDEELKICFHQIYKMIDQESKFGLLPVLVAVDEDDFEEVIKSIDRKRMLV